MTTWQSIDAFLTGLGIRIGAPTAAQTTGGTHVGGSYHYLGTARDYGSSSSDVAAITAALVPHAQGPDAPIAELFDSRSGVFYDNGAPITPSAELRRDHYDHVHVALRPGVALTDAVAGAVSAAADATGIAAGARRIVVEAVLVAGAIGLVVLGVLRTAHRPQGAMT